VPFLGGGLAAHRKRLESQSDGHDLNQEKRTKKEDHARHRQAVLRDRRKKFNGKIGEKGAGGLASHSL